MEELDWSNEAKIQGDLPDASSHPICKQKLSILTVITIFQISSLFFTQIAMP